MPHGIRCAQVSSSGSDRLHRIRVARPTDDPLGIPADEHYNQLSLGVP